MTTLTRRQTLTATAGAALAATVRPALAAQSTPLLPSIPAAEDYEFSAYIEVNLGRWTPKAPNAVGGTVAKGTYQTASTKYLLTGGRVGGAWDLTMRPILVEDTIYGEDIEGPVLIEAHGQTDGPEPLDLLQAALGGHLPQPGQGCIYDLSEREFAGLVAFPPAAQARIIADLQDPDSDDYRPVREMLRV